MTVAVCLKCGAMKWGAYNPCPKCHYRPEGREDKARHVMVSDHHFSRKGLEKISQRIQNGLPVPYDSQQRDEFVKTIEEMGPEPKRNPGIIGMILGYGIFVVIVIAAILGLEHLVRWLL